MRAGLQLLAITGLFLSVAVFGTAQGQRQGKKPVRVEQAKVTVKKGDTLYFPFTSVVHPDYIITAFRVKVNGKVLPKPKTAPSPAKKTSSGQIIVGSSELNCVWEARQPGTYRIEITPVLGSGKTDETRKFTVVVK
jgi:hypothetical protein